MRLKIAGRGVVAVLVALASTSAAQDLKRTRLRGYVVEVVSPTELRLDDYRLDEQRTYRVNLEGVQGLPSEPVQIGADLELEGLLDSTTGDYRASTMKRQSRPVDKTPKTTTISTAVPIESGERGFWSSLRLEIKEPDFERRRSGGVTIKNDIHYEIMAYADIQRYVADLGWQLVPPYQRDLPDGDPQKLAFKFYVVKLDQAGATSLANGVVMVFSRTFEILQNEAELASVLSHEIAHITQKHLWKLQQMAPSTVRTDFERSFENQADRLSLEYAVRAGYDPREAAQTWKQMARKLGFTPLRGSHENYAVRRAFIMGELEANYSGLDYRGLKTEPERYRQMAERVKKPY